MSSQPILRTGSKGVFVRVLQETLNNFGYALDVDGVFGIKTRQAVKAFQARVGILQDGIVGADTYAMLAVSPFDSNLFITDFAQQILLQANSKLGVRENPLGSNRGRDVELFLKSIGLGGGYAWCMAFVYWAVDETAKKMGITNPLFKTGGVLMQWNQRPKLRVATPQAGDIFIMDFGGGKGHAGFVESVSNDYINTIEGNTNDEGSREGFEVCYRTRKPSLIKEYIRILN